MAKRWTILMVSLLGVFLLAACGGGSDGSGKDKEGEPNTQAGKDFTTVIARVGDVEITQAYFDDRYKMLTPDMQMRFSGDNWKQRFLNEIIDEVLLAKEAEKEKFDRDPEVQKKLEFARRNILVTAYTDWIKNHAEATEDEVQEYWEKNKEEFRGLSRILVFHIQCKDKNKIDQAYAKLEAGEQFERVAAEYDEGPESSPNNGLIGWINPDGYVLGVGYDKTFTDTAFALGYRKYSEPLYIKGNWHIILRGEKVKGKIPALDDVRDKVVEDLHPMATKDFYERKLKEIKKEVPVERYGEFRLVDADNAEQLYMRASDARNPYARIDYFSRLVEHFPDSEYADDSLFMMGFLRSEALGRPSDALRDFRRLMQNYPESEYVDDAQWMITNTGQLGLQKVGARDAQGLKNKINDIRSGQ